jgi:hypothetical protein
VGDIEMIDIVLRYIPFLSVTLLAVLTSLSAKTHIQARRTK